MPYSAKKPPKDLVNRIKKKYPKATKGEVRKFVHIFNNSVESGDSESAAFSKAWGVLKRDNKRKAELVTGHLTKLANVLDCDDLTKESLMVDALIVTAQEDGVKQAYQNFMQKINTFKSYLNQYLEMHSHTAKDKLRLKHMVESIFPMLSPTLSIVERTRMADQKISDFKILGEEGSKLADFLSKGIFGINEAQKSLELAKASN